MYAGSIYEAFAQAAERAPRKIALIYLGRHFTYAQLKEMVDRLAGALYQLGLTSQEKAIIYQPHTPQWIICWLALQRLGAVAVPITHFYGPRELHYIAKDSGAETVFCTDTNFGYVMRVLGEASLRRVVISKIAELLPMWKQVIGRALDKIPQGKFVRQDNVYTFAELLKGGRAQLPNGTAPSESDLAELLYTGGTTGFPKGVPITHALFLQSTYYQRKMSEPLIPRGRDVVIQGAPLYHILGQAVGIGALLAGDTLVLLPRVNLDALFDHIQRYRVTTFFGAPTLYRMILEHDRLDYYNLSSLIYCFSGGDALPAEVARRWQKKLGRPIYQGYGATETCGGVALTPAGEPFPEGAAGKILPVWQIRLTDPDTLETVPPGEAGELLVSSDRMVTAYWNKPEETAERFVELDGRLWYRTGDIVRVDENGWLFFVDRSADIIKHKGYRVAASKVERVLQEHPAVVAACVVGVPDAKVGERIKAFVVLKEDVKGVTAHELSKWCQDRLASYEVPQYIEFRDMLPKSKVGKLLRRELRAEERRKLEAS